MCGNLFGGADSGSADAATAQAQQAATQALNAQLKAQSDASAAADTNSEGDREASEARQRQLAAAGTFGAMAPGSAPAAGTTFTRQLFGQ